MEVGREGRREGGGREGGREEGGKEGGREDFYNSVTRVKHSITRENVTVLYLSHL